MNRLVARLNRLPGIGKRSAERLAFYLLKQPAQEAIELAAAITDLKHNTRHCSTCFNLTESDPCPICSDVKRDRRVILVVEQPSDITMFETTGSFHGVYHVLMGRLSPLDGIGPGELNIQALLRRVESTGPVSNHCDHEKTGGESEPIGSEIHESTAAQGPHRCHTEPAREVILGLSPTLEGDGTALYLAQQLEKMSVVVTRLARGLPTGSSLELVSKAVLSDAIQGRQSMTVD